MPKLNVPREKATIEVWNVCACGEILHSLAEAKRGTCSSCWVKTLPADTKQAFNKLLAAAFKPTSEEEKGKLVDDLIEKRRRDEIEGRD